MKISFLAVACLLVFGGFAFAAEPPAKPVPPPPPTAQPVLPITLSAEDINQLTTYLGTQPYNLASPLLQFLATKESAAQAAAAGISPPKE